MIAPVPVTGRTDAAELRGDLTASWRPCRGALLGVARANARCEPARYGAGLAFGFKRMTVLSVLFRFLLGGVFVSAFAAIGSSFKPRSFAGLFGSAPSIALVSLAVAFAQHGSAHVALARSSR